MHTYEVGDRPVPPRFGQKSPRVPTRAPVKSSFGWVLLAKFMLTFCPTLPPTPVSPGTYAFWMVPRPSVRLDRLKQLKPHAGVAFGLTPALATLAAERPITEVTATPAASTEHALAKRLRMGIPSFSGLRQSDCHIPAAWAVKPYPITAGDNAETMLVKVTLVYIPPRQSLARTLPRVVG